MKLWIAKDTLQEANSFHIYLFPVSHSLLQYVTWLIELYVFQVYIRTYWQITYKSDIELIILNISQSVEQFSGVLVQKWLQVRRHLNVTSKAVFRRVSDFCPLS